MYTLLLMGNSIDNSDMVMLIIEPTVWIITLHKNYYLTSYLISCRHFHDSRNAATSSKPNVALATAILK